MKEAEKQQKKVNFFLRYISHAFVVGVIHRIHPKAGTEDLLGEADDFFRSSRILRQRNTFQKYIGVALCSEKFSR